MALLTSVPRDEASKLLSEYGLQLKEWIPLAAGSVNSNFLLSTESGERYFARLYEEQGADGATFELLLNETLARAGIPVAQPLRRSDGAVLSQYSGKPFAVYRHVEGEISCQKLVSPEACRVVGQALARVHLAPLGDLKVSEGRFGMAAIEQRLEQVERSGRDDLMAATDRLRELLTRLKRERSANLPSGLIHGDLFRDNVLLDRSGKEPRIAALLDFESACAGPYVYDLVVTILAWCFGSELSADLARALVAGYHEVRPLSQEERAQMKVEGAMACARFATTRLTDFSLRAAPGETPVRDYERFFHRLSALQDGALDRAIASVF